MKSGNNDKKLILKYYPSDEDIDTAKEYISIFLNEIAIKDLMHIIIFFCREYVDISSFMLRNKLRPDDSEWLLQQKNINDNDCLAIGTVLENNMSITQLTLPGKNIGIEGADAIGNGLQRNTTVGYLTLNFNLDIKKMRVEKRLNHTNKGMGDVDVIIISYLMRTNSIFEDLDLFGNMIDDEGSRAIGSALRNNTLLTSLSLSYNCFGDAGVHALFSSLSKNLSLQMLFFAGNMLNDSGFQAICDSLVKNSTLHTINLESNTLCDKKIKILVRALRNNFTLQNLYLGDNNIGDGGAKIIAECLKNNSVIHRLHLEGNNICDTGTKYIADALKVNSTLLELDLGNYSAGNNIGIVGAEAIAEALKKNKSLIKLSLAGNKFGDTGTIAMCIALEETTSVDFNPGILGFDTDGLIVSNIVSASQAEKKGIQVGWVITKMNSVVINSNFPKGKIDSIPKTVHDNAKITFATNKSGLQHLNLRENNITIKSVEAICRTLKWNKTLKFLNLSKNMIDYEGIHGISQALKMNKTLEFIKIDSEIHCNSFKLASWINLTKYEGCTDNDAIIISALFSVNTRLSGLCFGDTRIGDKGVTAIFKNLKHNAKIIHLSFNNIPIRTTGAESICDFLMNNSTLQSIFLVNNSIGDEEAKYIANSLEINTALKELRLGWRYNRGNNICNVGASAIAQALENQMVLEILHLSNNKIGDAGAKAIGRLLNTNICLKNLYLKKNKIRNGGAVAICNGLKENTTLVLLDISFNPMSPTAYKNIKETRKDTTADIQGYYVFKTRK